MCSYPHIYTFLISLLCFLFYSFFFFFNDTATTEIYTLSLHDALPIFHRGTRGAGVIGAAQDVQLRLQLQRSEEHTSELQSRENLVCRLLLEKKKKKKKKTTSTRTR